MLKILFAVKIPTANLVVFAALTTASTSSVPIATLPPKVDTPVTLKLANSDVLVVLVIAILFTVKLLLTVKLPPTLTLPTTSRGVLSSLYEVIPILSSFSLPLTYFILV